jgi:hypothetical protein
MKRLDDIRKSLLAELTDDWVSADEVFATINGSLGVSPLGASTPATLEMIAALLKEKFMVLGSFEPDDVDFRFIPWSTSIEEQVERLRRERPTDDARPLPSQHWFDLPGKASHQALREKVLHEKKEPNQPSATVFTKQA